MTAQGADEVLNSDTEQFRSGSFIAWANIAIGTEEARPSQPSWVAAASHNANVYDRPRSRCFASLLTKSTNTAYWLVGKRNSAAENVKRA
jgi:hypothetical protein